MLTINSRLYRVRPAVAHQGFVSSSLLPSIFLIISLWNIRGVGDIVRSKPSGSIFAKWPMPCGMAFASLPFQVLDNTLQRASLNLVSTHKKEEANEEQLHVLRCSYQVASIR